MSETKPRIPNARSIMTGRVHVIPADSDCESAARLLLKWGHSGAPVVDADGVPQGVLSEHDCVRVLAQAVVDGWPRGLAADHMTREIETVSPDDDILNLATLFVKNRRRRLFVVEDGRLCGVVTRRDLLEGLSALERRGRGRPPGAVEVMETRHRELD